MTFVAQLEKLLREHNVELDARLGYLHVKPGEQGEMTISNEVGVNLGHKTGKGRAFDGGYFIKVN